MVKKKSKMWIWIILALILIGVGFVIYFMFSGGDVSVISSGGNSIPKPPALPS